MHTNEKESHKAEPGTEVDKKKVEVEKKKKKLT